MTTVKEIVAEYPKRFDATKGEVMFVCFELTMPNCGSWNGKWTGSSNYHAKVINVGASKKARAKWKSLIADSPYSYNFGDGWTASVCMREMTSTEARKARKRSCGFCGYDWMIDSIRDKGEIVARGS